MAETSTPTTESPKNITEENESSESSLSSSSETPGVETNTLTTESPSPKKITDENESSESSLSSSSETPGVETSTPTTESPSPKKISDENESSESSFSSSSETPGAETSTPTTESPSPKKTTDQNESLESSLSSSSETPGAETSTLTTESPSPKKITDQNESSESSLSSSSETPGAEISTLTTESPSPKKITVENESSESESLLSSSSETPGAEISTLTTESPSPKKITVENESSESLLSSSSETPDPASDAAMAMASSRIDAEGKEAAAYQIVAAIDFGTTFSGYAYSFASNKQAINVNKNWGQAQGLLLYKTPTCLLLKEDGQFEAFGFEAVSKYNELSEEEACSYYYFDRFKMKLYNNNNLTTDITITDVNGKSQLAVAVVAHSLTFMKKHLLRAIGTHLGYDPHPDTVRWVLTVPAIWDENAKQFMREAAHKGGLIEKPNSQQLVIALEPEAASLHCRNLPASDFVGYKDSALTKPSFEPGTKYLVVDAGGGTIDCVSHKIRKDGRIRELFRATGGAWGATIIDRQFQNLLESIFGEQFIETFQKEYPKDFVELLQDFEIKKRGESESIRVSLPYNFCNFKHENVSVQEAIKNFSSEKGSNDIKFSSGKLVLSPNQVNALFKDALDQINDHVESLLNRPKCKDLHTIFMIGGFAESTRLQSAMREKFGERVTILVPEEASLSVVKGAVAFGHDPSAICQRICRFTYGVGINLPFEDGVHRDDLRGVDSDGKYFCKRIFQTWAEAGEVIGYNDILRQNFTPINNQRKIIFEFFRSSKKKIQYTDEKGLEKCGFLVVEMPDPTSDLDRTVDLEVIFGGTEIKVVGYTSTTRHETYIDFLST